MTKRLFLNLIICSLILSNANAGTLAQQDKFLILPIEKMHHWGKPKTLPSGAHDFILSGNPGKHELYAFRFELPANYKIPPFVLTSTSYITVISGKLYISEGNKISKSDRYLLSSGSYIVVPPNKPLTFLTKEKTILQFHGMGPLNVKYVNS